jgi:hypothetical protein
MRNNAVTYQSYANAAFRGADFHLNTIESILKHPVMQPSADSTDSIDQAISEQARRAQDALVWHTRGFFWELIAVFDTVLRWANERYGLGANSYYDFKWKGDKKKPGLCDATPQHDPSEWATKKEIIEGIWAEQWFKDVREFRNYAHEGFVSPILEYQCEALGEGKFRPVKFSRISLQNIPKVTPQYALDLPAQLTDYLTRMGAKARKLFEG